MRVYLPATDRLLAAVVDTGEFGDTQTTGFAVTPGLREWYVDDDIEELEYAATTEAARASLRLIDADAAALPRRVVIAADVDESQVTIRDDLDRGVVRIAAPVPLAHIASVHVDGEDAESAVRAAAAAITAADLGDGAAQELVDDAEGCELAWFATQEIPALVEFM